MVQTRILNSMLFFLLNVNTLFARAGGGGSGGSSGGSGGGGYGGVFGGRGLSNLGGSEFNNISVLIIYFAFLLGVGGILWIIVKVFSKSKTKRNDKLRELRRVKNAEIKDVLKELSLSSQWNPHKIKSKCRSDFFKIQKAWSNMDFLLLKEHLTIRLFKIWQRKLIRMRRIGLRDVITNIKIIDMNFVDIRNFKNDDKDEFTIRFRVRANDKTVSDKGYIIDERPKYFTEYWTYKYCEDKWLLGRVRQSNKGSIFIRNCINEGL